MGEHGLGLVADHDRHDVRVAVAEVEADVGEALAHVGRLLVELVDQCLSVGLEHVQDRAGRSHDGNRQGCAEQKGSRAVLDEVDDVGLAEKDAADAAKRL